MHRLKHLLWSFEEMLHHVMHGGHHQPESTCFGAAALHTGCKVEGLAHSHVGNVVVHLRSSSCSALPKPDMQPVCSASAPMLPAGRLAKHTPR